jgi:hypothetical protein
MLMDNKTLGKTLQVGVAIFLVMSLADLVLTWRLVSADNSEVDEINPVALWVLQNAGWTGLAAYKLTLASMIGVAAMMISRRKQIAGNSVIMFGCGAQASVVITGFLLLQGSKPHGNECLPEVMPDHRSSESYLGFPSDGYCLLVHASVQKELGLSAEYIQEFAEVTQKRRDLIRKMRTTNVCETYQDFHDLLVHEKIMGERLSPAQRHYRIAESRRRPNRGVCEYPQLRVAARTCDRIISHVRKAAVQDRGGCGEGARPHSVRPECSASGSMADDAGGAVPIRNAGGGHGLDAQRTGSRVIVHTSIVSFGAI